MKKSNLKKLTVTAILAAVAVVGSLFSFPVFGSKCAPVQHMVNILCAVTVGPWWALAQAFIASLIRNLLGLGSPLAFPGSMCGALLGGLLYKYGKKLPFAYIGEVVGTGILGGMLSYPVAYLVMGNTAATLFMFVVPFLISTCGGTAWYRTCEELRSKGVWRFHGRGNLASKAEVPGSCDRGAAL